MMPRGSWLSPKYFGLDEQLTPKWSILLKTESLESLDNAILEPLYDYMSHYTMLFMYASAQN